MGKRHAIARQLVGGILGLGMLGVAQPFAAASTGPSFTVIAASGQSAPGGGNFTAFGDPVINSQGLVSFQGLLNGGAGLYLGSPGQLEPYALQGSPAPAGVGYFAAPPGDFNGSGAFPFTPRLDSAGDAFYVGDFYAGGNDLYADSAGVFMNTTKAAISGDPTPDGAQFQFDFDLEVPPQVSPNGTAALLTQLGPCTNNGATCSSGIYLWSQGNWTRVVHQGDPTPEGDGTFAPTGPEDVMGFGPPAVNDAGQVAFTAHKVLSSGGQGADGLYLFNQSSLSKLVAQGDTLPDGRTAGGMYSVQYGPAMNAGGTVAVLMDTVNSQGTPDGLGIYLFGPNGAQAVLHTGDQDPAGSGQYICNLGHPGLGNDGTIAFTAILGSSSALCNTGTVALYVGKPGNLTQVAQVTQGSDVSMQGAAFIGPDWPAVNANGWVAFIVQRNGGTRTLEVWNGQSVLRILGTGDMLNGQTVTSVDLSGEDTPGATALNDAGELTFRAFTSTGSAIVVTAVNGSLATPTLPPWVPATPAPLSLPQTLTVGNQTVTFPNHLQNGSVGNTGGYTSTGFNLESGQAVSGIGSADVTLGSDSNGNPTLSGNLEVVTLGQAVAVPSPSTVSVTPGELLLVQDSAGNYVLMQILTANAAQVGFNYVIQGTGASTAGSQSSPNPPPGSGLSSGQSVTVGNQVVTFGVTPQSGAVGSGSGYVTTTFDFESGQAGNALGGGDLELGTDSSGNLTLTGNVEPVSSGQTLAVPTSATVNPTPGELLIVLDRAGHYVLVQIESVNANGVSFNYWMQTAVSNASGSSGSSGAPTPPSTPIPTPSPAQPSPSPTPPAGTGDYPQPVPQVTTVTTSPITVTALPAGSEADQTTVSIAQTEFPSGVTSHTAVLSSGDPNHLIDALTAGPLAYHLQAPLLMTASNTELGADLAYYLKTNQIQTIYLIGVLGGSDQATIAGALTALLPGVHLIPVTGRDRFQTADAIAAQLGTSSTLFVSSGEPGHLVDAVAATPAAALQGAPLVLEGPNAPVPASLASAASQTYVIGAAAGQSYANVNNDLAHVTFLRGSTRNQTASLIAQKFFPSAARAIVAPGDDSGLQWTLAAAPLAASWGAPLLLAEPGHYAASAQFLSASHVSQVLLGGSMATDPTLLAQVTGSRGSSQPSAGQNPSPAPAPGPTPLGGPGSSGTGTTASPVCVANNAASILSADGHTPLLEVSFATASDPQSGLPLIEVTINAPNDVSNVRMWQGGLTGGWLPWTTNLYSFGSSGNTWTFSLQLTDSSLPYYVDITSPSLTQAGYNPAEVVWMSSGNAPGCTAAPH
ncbi:MAG: cell wall-binding repeat-containing protein [Firmicutes bacterium]|nr:cell wall-binding repeat-containing protein [Alicyclobacillaceae bacterium]MCL6496108.1 cell wall-binding repeat-containing protein [Bacillota bacterium]